jgi:ParB/Sulfiredoxin domain
VLAAAARPYEEVYDGQGLSVARTLPVAQLSVGYSPRETKVDTSHVAVLMEVLDLLPPVIIDQRTMTVIDGVHRLEAFRQAGRTHIEAVMFTGQRPEAMVLAIKANVKHGKPLSRGERREAARSLLHAFPERSDRWVAEVCGLSHTTVALVRRSASLPNEKVRTGRDGRRRPVDRLAGQMAAARLIADHPATPVRQVAEAVGVAPSTVHRARARLQEPGRPPMPAPTPVAAVPGAAVHLAPALPVTPAAPVLPATPALTLPATPEMAEPSSWLARTAVSIDDLFTQLGALPLSRLYDVVDECRRRARTWSEIADLLEARARAGLTANRCLKA